jgi:S1-C subfamily serine protease
MMSSKNTYNNFFSFSLLFHRSGDLIIEANGVTVNETHDVFKSVGHDAGKNLTLVVKREGRQEMCLVRPATFVAGADGPDSEGW